MNEIFKNIPKEKQKKIIEVAFREFAQYGFEASSTNRIVKDIGISKGSLFKYFSTKTDLYAFLVQDAVRKLLSHFESYDIQGTNWKELVIEYASIEFDFLIEKPLAYKFFYNLATELELEELAFLNEELYQISGGFTGRLFTSIDLSLPENQIFRDHVLFVLNGYNENYLKLMIKDNPTSIEKEKYLQGLKLHLDLIRREK